MIKGHAGVSSKWVGGWKAGGKGVRAEVSFRRYTVRRDFVELIQSSIEKRG